MKQNGVIIGVTVGGILCGITVLCLLFVYRAKKQKQHVQQEHVLKTNTNVTETQLSITNNINTNELISSEVEKAVNIEPMTPRDDEDDNSDIAPDEFVINGESSDEDAIVTKGNVSNDENSNELENNSEGDNGDDHIHTISFSDYKPTLR